MKIVVTLIKFLGTLLLFALFGAFLYYVFISPRPSPLPLMNMGNFLLLILVLTMVAFALFSIFSEDMLSKRKNDDMIKLLSDKIKGLNIPTISSENNVLSGKLSLLLEQLNSAGTDTNKTLNLGIQQLNNRIDQLNDVVVTKNDKLSGLASNLEMIAAQITSTLNSGQNNTQYDVDLSPITDKLSMLEENFLNFSAQTTKSLNELQDITGKTNLLQDNDLTKQFNSLTQEFGNTQQELHQNIVQLQNDIADLTERQTLISEQIRDLQQQVKELPSSFVESGIAISKTSTTTKDDEKLEAEIEQIPETVEEDKQEDIAEAKEELNNEQEYVSEIKSEAEPKAVFKTEDSSENGKMYENKATETERKIQADIPFGKQIENLALAEAPAIYTTNLPEDYKPENPFGQQLDTPLTSDLPDLPGNINPDELSSDVPFGNENSDVSLEDVPAVDTNISADNPFGTPADLSLPSELDNMNTATENISAEEDMEESLNKIFNEQFAKDMSDLDILKDESTADESKNDEYTEIDLSTILDDTNS